MSSYMDERVFMRLYNALDKIIDHEVKTRILRILLKHDTEWTGRQFAKELKISPTTANKFLKELADEGVINVKGAGRAHLYSLNDKNYIVKNLLRPFFEKEKDLFSTITGLIKRVLLKTNVTIESVAIFGSVAQKAETAKSDIDILIVLHDLKNKRKIEVALDKISGIILQDFQTAISPYILSKEQFKKRYKEKKPIINEILQSYMLVAGKSLERIIA